MSEKCRMILADKSELEVRLEFDEAPGRRSYWVAKFQHRFESDLCTDRELAVWQVADALRDHGFDVREVLMPGEFSRNELIAQLEEARGPQDHTWG